MTKMVVPIHGPDHEFGGPDPFRPQLPFVWGHNDGNTQSVTDDEELEFSVVSTNDDGSFAFDPTDPAGLVITRRGLYEFNASVYGGGATPREIYAACQPLSSGALAGLGNAVGESLTGVFQLGPGGGYSAPNLVDATTPITKAALSYIGTARIAATPTSPWRAVVILQHLGTNYNVGGTQCSLLVKRIGTYSGSTPPLPPS